MHLDLDGINFIKGFESFSSKPYQDSGGTWTIGWGHTKGVTKDTPPITQAQAETFLWDDVEEAEKCLITYIKIILTQCEYDALCSLVFNIGTGAFKNSHILIKLNAGDKAGAAKEFDRWIHVRNAETGEEEVSSALQERRSLEKKLFLEDFNSVRSGVENA